MTDSGSTNAASVPMCHGSMSELFSIAVPLMISAGTQSLMNAADRIIVAGCSEASLAAITPASMLHWTAVCIPVGTILYANTFIAQYDGAGRPERMNASLWQAIWLAVFSGLILLLCLPFSRSLLALSGHSAEIVELEAQYFNTLCAGNPVQLLATALSCYFSGRRRTSVVMIVSMSAVAFNFGLDYLLVYGVGPFPELGLRGAALATVLARCGEVLVYLVLIQADVRRKSLQLWSAWRPDVKLLKKYLRFGVPSGMHHFLDNSGFTMFLLIVGNLSSRDLAATNLAFSVNGLIFVPLLGFGTAIQTLVGHHIGAGLMDAARRTTWNAALLGVLWTGVTGLMLVAFPNVALRPFFLFAGESGVDADSLARAASTLLMFVAVYSVFDALAVVFASSLRGAGDTTFPMLITLLSSWLVMVVPAALILRLESPTVTMLWLTCAANIGLTGTSMFLRWLSGKWKLIRLVEDPQVTRPVGD